MLEKKQYSTIQNNKNNQNPAVSISNRGIKQFNLRHKFELLSIALPLGNEVICVNT